MQGEDIEKYEKYLKQLLEERHRLFKEIRIIRKRKKFFEKNPTSQNDSLNGQPRKIQKLQDQSEDKDKVHPETIKEQLIKANEIQASVKDRNKRIFGGMTQYLKKARTTLVSEQSKVQDKIRQIKKKIQIQEKTLEKEKNNGQKMRQERRKRLEEQNMVVNEKKDKNAKQILRYQNLILHKKYANYVNQFPLYILTKTQPQIPWRPAKQSVLTKTLATQTRKQLMLKQTQILNTIDSYSEIFDLSKFLVENQQQYSKNKINRYYEHKNLNIVTQTQPLIFWRPIVWTPQLKEAQKISTTFLMEEKKAILQPKVPEGKSGQVVEEHSESEVDDSK